MFSENLELNLPTLSLSPTTSRSLPPDSAEIVAEARMIPLFTERAGKEYRCCTPSLPVQAAESIQEPCRDDGLDVMGDVENGLFVSWRIDRGPAEGQLSLEVHGGECSSRRRISDPSHCASSATGCRIPPESWEAGMRNRAVLARRGSPRRATWDSWTAGLNSAFPDRLPWQEVFRA
jgi:hypothetical protein